MTDKQQYDVMPPKELAEELGPGPSIASGIMDILAAAKAQGERVHDLLPADGEPIVIHPIGPGLPRRPVEH